jgi:hypothetical protein
VHARRITRKVRGLKLLTLFIVLVGGSESKKQAEYPDQSARRHFAIPEVEGDD